MHSALWILVSIWAVGVSLELNSSPPMESKNYDGAKRSFCPLSAFVHKQPPERRDTSVRLKQLRNEMSRVATVQGPPLDAFIITSDDEHQSESLDPRDMRREFITGFSGSSGEAVVTWDKAVLWTDGRYHIQADQQLDCNWSLMKNGRGPEIPSIMEWLKHEFRDRLYVRVGADPSLVPAVQWESWEYELGDNSTISLVPMMSNNLIDIIWQVGRPNYNPHAAYPLPDEYTGMPWQEKVHGVRVQMESMRADAFVVTALDEIAWLLNIRGYDLPNTPVLRAYVIITQGAVRLYAPRHKILRSVDTHLRMDACFHADCVKWHNYTSIWHDLRTMSQVWNGVWLPTRCGYSQGASMEVHNSIPSEKRLVGPSPILSMRAQKNKVEIEGMRRSHLRDAVAMCDFLAYMEEQYELNTEGWDEMQVARLANEFRYEQDYNKGISFPTIAGYGPHGAIPHYEPSVLTNIKIGTSSTLVIDSGGQYLDGTTDVTRTLHFGEPTEEQKKAYTRVLIGAIQLSSMIFPTYIKSGNLDAVARAPLWNVGYDYLHGTGHGIGHFLGVHESPISFSYTEEGGRECGNVKLNPGFFLSNEPGYYKEGDFGVRLENILEVVEAGSSSRGAQTFLRFRDATLVPYEPKLIDIEMLTPSHRQWLNNYNNRIREEVGPELKKHLRMKAFQWMEGKTLAIPDSGPVTEDPFAQNNSAFTGRKPFHSMVYLLIIYHIVLSSTHMSS